MHCALVTLLTLVVTVNYKIVQSEGIAEAEDSIPSPEAEDSIPSPEVETGDKVGNIPSAEVYNVDADGTEDSKKPSWLIAGGFTGWEGLGLGVATDRVELLTLRDISSPWEAGSWCQKNITSLDTPVESASINFLPLSSFVERNKAQSTFSSPHSLYNFDRLIICGGADHKYNIQNRCRWWDPELDTWSGDGGFRMLHQRYSPAAVVVNRGLWMLGGRDGSNILATTEFLPYPHTKGSTVIKKWSWIHEKSSWPQNWEGLELKESMKQLPMALAGHCAVRISKYTVVIGGGTTRYDQQGQPVPSTGPVPTSHVHLYDHRLGLWSSTLYPAQQDRKIKQMKTARINHACLLYKEDNKPMVMVAGGVTSNRGETDGQDQSQVLDSVEILDFAAGSWVEGGKLPRPITGASFIKVDNTPILLGRYGTEFASKMLKYNKNKKVWKDMKIALLMGRSHAQVIEVPGGAKCP